MKLRDTLAANVRALMAEHDDLATQEQIARKTGLSQSTIHRVLSRAVDANLDTLERLAGAYRTKATALLDAPSVGVSLERGQAPEPSYHEIELLAQWRRLTDADRDRVEAYIRVALLSSGGADIGGSATTHRVESVPAGLTAAIKNAAGKQPQRQDHGAARESTSNAKPSEDAPSFSRSAARRRAT